MLRNPKEVAISLVELKSTLPKSDCEETIDFWVDGIGDWTLPLDTAIELYRQTGTNGRVYLRWFIANEDEKLFEDALFKEGLIENG